MLKVVRSGPILFFRFSLLIAVAALAGCATPYESTALKSWDRMANGKSLDAIPDYEKTVTSDKEKLLKLMDEGILYRVAGDYPSSNEKFFAAAKIVEMNGYLSLGEQSLSVLSNEKQTTYQGEDFEKVLVHLYLGLNFISMNQPDEALVETRKVNEILYKMISEAHRPYEINAFARYLGGVLFENEGNLNDAFVSYKDVVKTDPSLTKKFPAIGEDLIRVAKQGGFQQELDEYKSQFSKEQSQQALQSLAGKEGSLVFVLESGKSPEKYSSREQRTTKNKGGSTVEVLIPVAYYKNRATQIRSASVQIAGQEVGTVVLNDIEKTAIKHLQDRMGRTIAKALLTAGVKAGIATGVGMATNSKELGLIAGLAMFATSEADTRSWLLLPAELQVAKVFLKSGKYPLHIRYKDALGQVVKTQDINPIDIKASRATIIQARVFQ